MSLRKLFCVTAVAFFLQHGTPFACEVEGRKYSEGVTLEFSDGPRKCVKGQFEKYFADAVVVIQELSYCPVDDHTGCLDYTKIASRLCDDTRDCSFKVDTRLSGGDKFPNKQQYWFLAYHCASASAGLSKIPGSTRKIEVGGNTVLEPSCR